MSPRLGETGQAGPSGPLQETDPAQPIAPTGVRRAVPSVRALDGSAPRGDSPGGIEHQGLDVEPADGAEQGCRRRSRDSRLRAQSAAPLAEIRSCCEFSTSTVVRWPPCALLAQPPPGRRQRLAPRIPKRATAILGAFNWQPRRRSPQCGPDCGPDPAPKRLCADNSLACRVCDGRGCRPS